MSGMMTVTMLYQDGYMQKKYGDLDAPAITKKDPGVAKLPDGAILLGRGYLSWDKSERASDRYGYVYLGGPGGSRWNSEKYDYAPLDTSIPHQTGALYVVIEKPIKSSHLGDLFRNIFPRKRAAGTVLKLGEGLLDFNENSEGQPQVGLIPKNLRNVDWLNVRALYDAHESGVALYFVPGDV